MAEISDTKRNKKESDEKAYYTFRFTHSEESFTALAHMQYDLFCRRNLMARTLVAATAILAGARFMDRWWSILLIAYGGYLLTGRYVSANHTVRKLVDGIKKAGLPFPSSKYTFTDRCMKVTSMPDGEELEPLYYSSVCKLGQDARYFYLFRDEHGGYMIPREKLGDNEPAFKKFLEERTGKSFMSKRTSPMKRLREYMKERNSEPYHL